MKRIPLRRSAPLRRSRKRLAGKYASPEWRALRLRVLLRDGGRCQLKGPDCLGDADQVHHEGYGRGRHKRRLLVPMEQLVSCCGPCHAAIEREKRRRCHLQLEREKER